MLGWTGTVGYGWPGRLWSTPSVIISGYGCYFNVLFRRFTRFSWKHSWKMVKNVAKFWKNSETFEKYFWSTNCRKENGLNFEKYFWNEKDQNFEKQFWRKRYILTFWHQKQMSNFWKEKMSKFWKNFWRKKCRTFDKKIFLLGFQKWNIFVLTFQLCLLGINAICEMIQILSKNLHVIDR